MLLRKEGHQECEFQGIWVVFEESAPPNNFLENRPQERAEIARKTGRGRQL